MIELKGSGKIRTFTTVNVASEGLEDEVPYTIVMVELDEGPWLMGNLDGIDPQNTSMELIGHEGYVVVFHTSPGKVSRAMSPGLHFAPEVDNRAQSDFSRKAAEIVIIHPGQVTAAEDASPGDGTAVPGRVAADVPEVDYLFEIQMTRICFCHYLLNLPN